jgi:hypothetical protein
MDAANTAKDVLAIIGGIFCLVMLSGIIFDRLDHWWVARQNRRRNSKPPFSK